MGCSITMRPMTHGVLQTSEDRSMGAGQDDQVIGNQGHGAENANSRKARMRDLAVLSVSGPFPGVLVPKPRNAHSQEQD